MQQSASGSGWLGTAPRARDGYAGVASPMADGGDGLLGGDHA